MVKKKASKKKATTKKPTKKKAVKSKAKKTTVDKTTIPTIDPKTGKPVKLAKVTRKDELASIENIPPILLEQLLKIQNTEQRHAAILLLGVPPEPEDDPTKKATDPPPIPLPILRVLVEMYYDFQNTRIRTSNRSLMNLERNKIPAEALKEYGVEELFKTSVSFEKAIEKRIRQDLKNRPIYTEYLSLIKGMGPVLAAGLIAWIQTPANYDNISKLWQNAGMGMNQYCEECNVWVYAEVEIPKTDREGNVKMTKAKRLSGKVKECPECKNGLHLKPHPQQKAAGMQINWNPKFKTLCWKIGSSFIKQKASKAFYRALYDSERQKIDARFPEADPKFMVRGKARLQHNPKHHFEHAKRVAVKQFLGHFWIVWRTMEGQNVREPFRPKDQPPGNHRFTVPEVDEGDIPQEVKDKLNELNAKANCYPEDLKNSWIPRVDKTSKDDAETQELNDAELDDEIKDDSN